MDATPPTAGLPTAGLPNPQVRSGQRLRAAFAKPAAFTPKPKAEQMDGGDVNGGTFLGPAGGCPEVNLGGKVWKIGHPTQRAKECLESLCAGKASAEILALKGSLDAAGFALFFDAHKRDITSGSYRTWGEGWQRISFSPLNAHLFLLSLVRENHPDATEWDARSLALGAREETELALAQVVPAFFTMLLDDLPVPAEKKTAVRLKMDEAMKQFLQPKPPAPPEPPTTPTSAA